MAIIHGITNRSRIEVVLNDGEVEFDVWFNPGNPRNTECFDAINKALNSHYAKSGKVSDIAKVSRTITDNFDGITDPGTAEQISRYDTSDDYPLLYSVIDEMRKIIEQYKKDRDAAAERANDEADEFIASRQEVDAGAAE